MMSWHTKQTRKPGLQQSYRHPSQSSTRRNTSRNHGTSMFQCSLRWPVYGLTSPKRLFQGTPASMFQSVGFSRASCPLFARGSCQKTDGEERRALAAVLKPKASKCHYATYLAPKSTPSRPNYVPSSPAWTLREGSTYSPLQNCHSKIYSRCGFGSRVLDDEFHEL